MKKKKNYDSYFMNEQKILSFVLYSITGAHRNKKPLRNVNSGSVLKKLSRNPKA